MIVVVILGGNKIICTVFIVYLVVKMMFCRCNDKNLKMDQTLEENGILDERDEFSRLGLPPNLYVPAIFLYYNDDFIYEEE